MTHVSHVDAVNVDQDVSLLEVFATRPVQDGLDLLSVGAVGDGETETHSTFGYLHRQEFNLVGSCRWIAIDSSIAVFITCLKREKGDESLNTSLFDYSISSIHLSCLRPVLKQKTTTSTTTTTAVMMSLSTSFVLFCLFVLLCFVLTVKPVNHVVILVMFGALHQQVGTSGTRWLVAAVLLGDGHSSDDLRVGIVGVEGQRISSADL